jgi:hypothetical protein
VHLKGTPKLRRSCMGTPTLATRSAARYAALCHAVQTLEGCTLYAHLCLGMLGKVRQHGFI